MEGRAGQLGCLFKLVELESGVWLTGGGGGGGVNTWAGKSTARRCPSQELVLPQMHPLYDVATVTEDAADVFCVDRAGEVGVTVMPAFTAGCADPLEKSQNNR